MEAGGLAGMVTRERDGLVAKRCLRMYCMMLFAACAKYSGGDTEQQLQQEQKRGMLVRISQR